MATTGKKGKKSKGKTVTLHSFLAEQTPVPAGQAVVIPRKTLSWTDEVEEAESYEYSRKPAMPIFLPTAPRAARSNDIDEARIPKNPPYVAYLSNLSYEVEGKDITDFFQDLNVTIVRLPKDERSGRLKGFGYVEFGDRNSFVQALQIYETTIKGRRIRIEIADNNDVDRRRGGPGGGGRDNRDRDNGNDESASKDWRSGPRADLPPLEDRRGASSGARRGDFTSRGFGDKDNRSSSDTWRDSTGRDKRFQERPSFGSRREPEPEAKTRPKLQLQPRTLPIEEIAPREEPVEEKEPEVKRAQPLPAASIFGAAKPVDTAAREREIEERLAKEKDRSPQREVDKSQDVKKLEPATEPKESVWVRRALRAEQHKEDEEESGEGHKEDEEENEDKDKENSDEKTDDNREDQDDDREKSDEVKDNRDVDNKENDRPYRRQEDSGRRSLELSSVRRYNDREEDRRYNDRERRYNDNDRDRRYNDRDDKDRRFNDRDDKDRRYNDNDRDRRYNDREDRDRRYNDRDDRDRRYNDRDDKDRRYGRDDKDRRFTDRDDKDRRFTDRDDKDRRFTDRDDKDRRFTDRDDKDKRFTDRVRDRDEYDGKKQQDRDGPRYRDQDDKGSSRRGGGTGAAGGGGEKIRKPPQDRGPQTQRVDRSARKTDEPIKMPKLKEADAPNYVGTNKYSYLGDNDVSE